jgi:hypothetical protein
MVTAPKTGAYLEGEMRNFHLQLTDTPLLALAVLQISVGTKSLSQLASIISTDLKLPNDQAQKMSSEIERDLFAPIMLEYNQFIASQKKQTGTSIASAQNSGAHNVLDLKTQPKPPLPPPIPPSIMR